MITLKKYFYLALLIVPMLYVETVNAAEEITVYKSPTCGCCQGWVNYLEDNGFVVETHDIEDMDEIKNRYDVNPEVKSCHTGIINGYVIEGHVPVQDIKRLIEEKPDILGISAPGMPMMSPGMASIIPKDYDVITFDKENNIEVYSKY